jgi:hypothetical protein
MRAISRPSNHHTHAGGPEEDATGSAAGVGVGAATADVGPVEPGAVAAAGAVVVGGCAVVVGAGRAVVVAAAVLVGGGAGVVAGTGVVGAAIVGRVVVAAGGAELAGRVGSAEGSVGRDAADSDADAVVATGADSVGTTLPGRSEGSATPPPPLQPARARPRTVAAQSTRAGFDDIGLPP